MQKHRNDMMDQGELARALGVSFATIDRALIERSLPMPSTGAVPGLRLWHRDEIWEWIARQESPPRYLPQYFARC